MSESLSVNNPALPQSSAPPGAHALSPWTATPAPDYTLAVPGGERRTLAIGWLLLGLIALIASGIFSILLVLSRTPYLQNVFPVADFFHVALVVHVDLSVLVWFLAFAGVVWSPCDGFHGDDKSESRDGQLQSRLYTVSFDDQLDVCDIQSQHHTVPADGCPRGGTMSNVSYERELPVAVHRLLPVPCDGFHRDDKSEPRDGQLQSRLYPVSFHDQLDVCDVQSQHNTVPAYRCSCGGAMSNVPHEW